MGKTCTPKRTIIDKIKGRIIKQPVKRDSTQFPISGWGKFNPSKDFQCKLYPSLVPGWDNTSRRGENPTLILEDSTPEYFEHWLSNVKADFTPYSEDENFIFINAWNEWAEGNHLEPDMKFGTQYLESVKKIFSDQL